MVECAATGTDGLGKPKAGAGTGCEMLEPAVGAVLATLGAKGFDGPPAVAAVVGADVAAGWPKKLGTLDAEDGAAGGGTGAGGLAVAGAAKEKVGADDAGADVGADGLTSLLADDGVAAGAAGNEIEDGCDEAGGFAKENGVEAAAGAAGAEVSALA